MSYRPEFYCLHVDHKTLPIPTIAKYLQVAEQQTQSLGTDAAVLATCQRLEVYLAASCLNIPELLFGTLIPSFRIISGEFNVAMRLASIAMGCESCLLGERFIANQVTKAFKHISDGEPLGRLAAKALSTATSSRELLGFRAPVDYGDLSYQLVWDAAVAGKADTMIIVGSGALGRALADHPQRKRYSRVAAVSRWPKQLAHKLVAKEVVCLHPEQTFGFIAGQPFDLLAAVAGANEKYLAFLRSLIELPSRRFAVDLSTTPIFGDDRPTAYVHEYDDCFTAMLAEAGSPLQALLPTALDMLATRLS